MVPFGMIPLGTMKMNSRKSPTHNRRIFCYNATNIRAELLVRFFRDSDNAHKGRVSYFSISTRQRANADSLMEPSLRTSPTSVRLTRSCVTVIPKNWKKSAVSPKSVAFVALMLNWMLAHDSVKSTAHEEWQKKLEGVIDGFLTRFPKLASHSGFTPVWKKSPLWWQV